jgi:hypothetical protein
VPPSARALEPIMVRRLKSDLRAPDVPQHFPERQVIALEITAPDAPAAAELLARMRWLALQRPDRQARGHPARCPGNRMSEYRTPDLTFIWQMVVNSTHMN